MQLVLGSLGGSAALEIAGSHALLERVARGELESTLRLYTAPATVAFGRLDALRAGYDRAVRAAREHGFEPVLRLPGGHAAAYHEASVGIDVVVADPDPIPRMHERFEEAADLLAVALRTLGVDAGVGEVPGEYCPGAYSVNARGRVKLVGTAQRVIRGASLLGAHIVVRDAARVRDVLRDVYAALELDWDVATAGAVDEEAPGVDEDIVEDAVIDAYRLRHDLTDGELDAETVALARALEGEHRPEAGQRRRARSMAD